MEVRPTRAGKDGDIVLNLEQVAVSRPTIHIRRNGVMLTVFFNRLMDALQRTEIRVPTSLKAGSKEWKESMGLLLFHERQNRGLSLREAARKIGIPKSRSGEIGYLERCKVWNWPMLFRLLECYNLTLETVPYQAARFKKGMAS